MHPGLIPAAIWFFLPAGLANATPVWAARLFPRFSYPLDCYLTIRGHRLLGDHKTMRGILSGVVMAECIYLIQIAVSSEPIIAHLSWYDYTTEPLMLGVVFGIGALLGDAAKSFIKRLFRIRPGVSWLPFDQIDWIVGMFVAIYPYVRISYDKVILCFVIGFILHIISKIIGKWLSLNPMYI